MCLHGAETSQQMQSFNPLTRKFTRLPALAVSRSLLECTNSVFDAESTFGCPQIPARQSLTLIFNAVQSAAAFSRS